MPSLRKLALLNTFSCANSIQNFHITLDQKMILCAMQTRVADFNELFKAQFALQCPMMKLCATSTLSFRQTTVYGTDVGSVKESLHVKEIRARTFHSAIWGGTHLWPCSPMFMCYICKVPHTSCSLLFRHKDSAWFVPRKIFHLNCE